ncbi:ATP-binding protein [Herbaspirillum sp. SJZ107]|uniref:hybrid sensor histidine kinase/response regulator n=1 Tax=Herbaspirillum sp. SJZ107 TaxID=2572881 RepID=UPI0011502041|nr:ATP-binding protein [Herbaspirillum sp. SJZ107]
MGIDQRTFASLRNFTFMSSIKNRLFVGDGQVRALLRDRDWSDFPLGEPDTWPAPLKTALQLMLDSTQPTCLSWGDQLSFFYNDAYIAVLGQKHPQALAKPFWQVWAEVESTLALEVNETLAGGSVFNQNVLFRIFRKEQPEDTWFTYSLLPLRDEYGQVVGVFNPCMETTSQIRGEQRADFFLRLADRLKGLTVPDEITLAASEALGSYLRAARVLYAEVNDAAGTFTIRQDWTRDGLASVAGEVRTLDSFGAQAISTLRAGQALLINDVTQDLRTADHADAYKKIGISASLTIPLMRSGQFTLMLSVHQTEPYAWTDTDVQLAYDLAERTWAAAESARAYQELLIERDRSQAVFDTMTEGFGMLDANWNVLYMNAEGLRIGNRPGQKLVGGNHWELWPEVVGSDLERMYRRVMQTRAPESVEFLHAYLDRDPGWLEVRAYPGVDGGLSIFFRDVNNRKEAEEKLRDADRRKDEFLAMLAHELRNPLAPIGAAAQLLQLGKLDNERVKKTSEVIGRQVNHMTGLIDDLLDVSRVTSGRIELDKVELDIDHVINDAVEQVNPLIRARRHELVVRHPSQAGTICGDRKRLVQVMANVLNNAAKYTADGGHIALTTLVREADVLIEVTDDGIGMTPEMSSHAFDLFAQAERTSDRSSGGLGLGLSLVKSLVELHGGIVTCKSDGLGKGSTFSIVLPLLRPNANPASVNSVVVASETPATARLRILVVDDNVDAAEMLKLVLEASGHDVMVEHGAHLALETSKREQPDVCLLDIGLPDIDGNELARQLRAQPETREAVLVAVTGYGQDRDRNDALAAGFNHHLVKPVDIAKLASILSAVKPI